MGRVRGSVANKTVQPPSASSVIKRPDGAELVALWTPSIVMLQNVSPPRRPTAGLALLALLLAAPGGAQIPRLDVAPQPSPLVIQPPLPPTRPEVDRLEIIDPLRDTRRPVRSGEIIDPLARPEQRWPLQENTLMDATRPPNRIELLSPTEAPRPPAPR